MHKHIFFSLVFIFICNGIVAQNWSQLFGSYKGTVIPNYDVANEDKKSNIFGARSKALFCQANDTVFIFGGWGPNNDGKITYLNDLWVYNIRLNKFLWLTDHRKFSRNLLENATSLQDDTTKKYPTPRWGSVFTKVNNKLILIGGKGMDTANKEIYLKDIWEFDLEKLEWKMVTNNDPNLQGGTFEKMWNINNVLYLIGGQKKIGQRIEVSGDFLKYDLERKQLTKLQSIPTTFNNSSREQSSAIITAIGAAYLFQNKIYIKNIINEQTGLIENKTMVYDINNNNWQIAETAWQIFDENKAVAGLCWQSANLIYTLSGYELSEGQKPELSYRFQKLNLENNTIENLNEPSKYRQLVIPNSIGLKTSVPDNWPGARTESISFLYKNRLYLIGGRTQVNGSLSFVNDVWCYTSTDIDTTNTQPINPLVTTVSANSNTMPNGIASNQNSNSTNNNNGTNVNGTRTCEGIKLFPVPTGDFLSMQFASAQGAITYIIKDQSKAYITGDAIIDNANKIISTDVSQLLPGTYFVEIKHFKFGTILSCEFIKK